MPKQKMKSHRGAMKRFKVTASGKVKMYKGYKSHLLTGKSAKRTRRLRTGSLVSPAFQKNIRSLLSV